jgi:hexulose-6-phosphate isomerase
MTPPGSLNRRGLLAGAASAAGVHLLSSAAAPISAAEASAAGASEAIVLPPEDRRILLSCKLTMIARERDGQPLGLADRLRLARDAGFDGVDLDEAGSITPQAAREAVRQSGVFVHNAINHAHWQVRLTSPEAEQRRQARENLAHCMRVAHAAGGNGVLIVVGRGDDGPPEEIEARCRGELEALLPLAAALAQPILVENVWNRMFYDHDAPPEQTAERFVRFIDSFDSPWIGMYFDIGNHWKYGQPDAWIRDFGRRCVKLDVKGFSRARDAFTEIDAGDLPWDRVREALAAIGFAGWATAEVEGGDAVRLATVRRQMEGAFGLTSRG